MKNRIIKPHAKRVNPYGCYDITRYGTFFNINVPRDMCQGCPYSASYKNNRNGSEKIMIAALLNKMPIPSKIKTQMELSGNKAAYNIMPSVLTIQGKEKHISKFDVIELNAFLLKYILSYYNIITLESKDNIIRHIKKGFRTVLLKDKELNNTSDYVYEALCNELLEISNIEIDNIYDEKKINDISEILISPYKYDRNKTIDIVRKMIADNTAIPGMIQPVNDNVPVFIEAVEIPITKKTVSIIDKGLAQDGKPQNKSVAGQNILKGREISESTHYEEKYENTEKQELHDPEQYYPVNYKINEKNISENILAIDENSQFPFLEQVDSNYMIAVEKCLYKEHKGLLLYDNDGKYYFYHFRESENKPLKELMRRRPLMLTMNSVELHAVLRKYRIYENRTADLKDMYISLNTSDILPSMFKSLFEKMSDENIPECSDFYMFAMKYYKSVYLSCLQKMSDEVLEIFHCHTAVSAAIGCSWYTYDIFEKLSCLYERKSLFEYQSLCPEKVSAKILGSFYRYWIDETPVKKEKFYSGLIQELVKKESIKLGKVIVLNISDNGLFLFAFETCGATYEILQWPCVFLARKLNIKNSHVHYYRQIHMPDKKTSQS